MEKTIVWQQQLLETVPHLQAHSLKKSTRTTLPSNKKIAIVLSGKVHLYAYHSEIDEPILVDCLNKNRCACNMKKPLQLVLHACDDSKILYLSQADIDKISEHNIELLLKINQHVEKQLHTLLQRLCYFKLSACDRVQELLNYLFCEYDSIDLSHAELAMMIGLTRETVSRSLYKIEKQGLISIENRHITPLQSVSYRLSS